MVVNFTMVTRSDYSYIQAFWLKGFCLCFDECRVIVQTFVYGDLYRYDVEKLEWKLISSPNSPPPRSAHQAVAWKNYLYIFGKLFC